MLYIPHTRWGGIRQICVPSAVFKQGTLNLSPPALAVLLVLIQIRKHKPKIARMNETKVTVRVGYKTLIARTGYSQNIITKAIHELTTLQFIQVVKSDRKKHGEFAIQQYILCDPTDGTPLESSEPDVYVNGSRLYFTFPVRVVTDKDQQWSLAGMTSSELKVYVSLLYRATRKENNVFESVPAELLKSSGIGTYSTMNKAKDGLEKRGLILIDDKEAHLCNPYTGVPLGAWEGYDEDNPSNYYMVAGDQRSRQINLNVGRPDVIEKLLRDALPDDSLVIIQGNGDLKIRCPFHQDKTPSCVVRVERNGCFKCFGGACGKSGSFAALLAQIKGIKKGDAIQQVAAALGQKAEYHPPDKNAIAIYDWKDERGNLVKQVLRYPNKPDGSKDFRQRRPGKGGDWIRNTDGVPPMLFNLDLLHIFNSDVVAITEGEKDACTVTNLSLRDATNGSGCPIIATTSGAAGTWKPQFAKQLATKPLNSVISFITRPRYTKAVVMADADEHGKGVEHAEQVKASLEAEGIECRVVTFEDVGAKDVTEFLEEHSVKELVRRIGVDWVCMPDGTRLDDYVPMGVPKITDKETARLSPEAV